MSTIRIIAICDWNTDTNECEIVTYSNHMSSGLTAHSDRSPIDAFRNLIEKMEEHDRRKEGIPE